MVRDDDNLSREIKEGFGTSRLSKLLFVLSWFILLCLLLSAFWRIQDYDKDGTLVSARWPWELTLVCFILWLCTLYLSYRLAGGRRNPVIWKNKSLFQVLKNACHCGEARIGFHSFRNQKNLLAQLSSIGIKKPPSKMVRQFLTEKIVEDPRAFEICQRWIVFEMIHQGREMFWDGYGNQKDRDHFHVAEIIVDLKSSGSHRFKNLLKGLCD
jgi:hypothetical protein